MDKQQSLEALEGAVWPEPSEDESPLVKRCHRLRKMPLASLGVEELRQLLSQQIGVRFLLPLALDMLAKDLLAEGDLFPGDLLLAVLRLPPTVWQDAPQAHGRLRDLLAQPQALDGAPLSGEARRQIQEAISRFALPL